MRVISGSAGGLLLRVPQGDLLRPTQDKVRGAIFSSIAARVPGARVLDLFAGTGAMGIEALSRGAAQATFVEQHPKCLEAIRENLRHCRVEPQARVLPRDVFAYLSAPECAAEFDLVFADPPYLKKESPEEVQEYYARLFGGISRWLAAGGLAVVGYFRPRPPQDVAPLVLLKEKHYGQTSILYLQGPV